MTELAGIPSNGVTEASDRTSALERYHRPQRGRCLALSIYFMVTLVLSPASLLCAS